MRKASSDQRIMNPALREGDIQVRIDIFLSGCSILIRSTNFCLISQVAVFEDIILGMKVRVYIPIVSNTNSE